MASELASWIPGWYELDQTIVVGDSGSFAFYEDPTRASFPAEIRIHPLVFSNDVSGDWFEAEATVRSIRNPDLGDLRAILTDGLDYRFVTAARECVVINAEEDPGFIDAWQRRLRGPHFEVELSDFRRKDQPPRRPSRGTQIRLARERRARQLALLGEFTLLVRPQRG